LHASLTLWWLRPRKSKGGAWSIDLACSEANSREAALLLACRLESAITLGPRSSGIRGRENMDTNTVLIIVLLVLLLGGGGFFYRRRA
jgi:LPXTG-motif cell wall-anchored protein